jgi:hypothetical protein
VWFFYNFFIRFLVDEKTTLKVLALKLLTNFEKPFSSNPTVAMKMLTGGRLLISNSLIWVKNN